MDAVSLYGSKYVLPACQFTAPRSGRDVMVFAGWRVNDIQGTLPAGTPIDITGDTVLTAVWTSLTLNKYTVFFDANGGNRTMDPYAMIKGTYTLPECSFEAPAGKQFEAWMVGTKKYAPGEKITVSAHTSVTALWKTAVSGAVLSGTVTSFGDANGDITLQLIEQGLTEPACETIVKGNTVNYSFASVAAGTYTLKVSKANHVTRQYTVTVGSTSIIQDVKIHLKGDIDGNGKVNVGDTTKVYSHVKKTALITDEYMLLCADIDGNGKINVGDTTKVYAHVKKTSPLW